MSEPSFPSRPFAPEGARALRAYPSLSTVRDSLTQVEADPSVAGIIQSIVDDSAADAASARPYMRMRDLLETLRRMPPGDARVRGMADVVRTLGRPEMLAQFLDGLRRSAVQLGTEEGEAVRRKLLGVRMHSIYGWCGNTLVIETSDEPTAATFPCASGLAERLGNAAAAWNLTVHVWQPNAEARGFQATPAISTRTILEPPHSHPFDFVSRVVKGEFRQSLYVQSRGPGVGSPSGHYFGVPLEHVDGIWPPHKCRETVWLKTLEHRVRLKQGDVYYMPCDAIHDVEVDGEIATSRPTITLFLSSEYMVMPHVYMSPEMADFLDTRPDIKSAAKRVPEAVWHKKLAAISAYLRNETTTLKLNQIVNHKDKFAFFHVRA